jgi:SAM-dependent methyltransferase
MTHWPSFLRELQATESSWNAVPIRYPREDAVPWLPFPLGQFVTLLTEAVAVSPPGPPAHEVPAITEEFGQPRFLDVGSGPGTKVRLAQALFGLNAYGIDIVPRFISEAQAHGARCMLKDAFELPVKGIRGGTLDPWGYADFQIVYVNRPSANQDELEHLVMDRMAPDSVLIAVNWRNDPGKEGWLLAYQEYGDPVCGVFIKP